MGLKNDERMAMAGMALVVALTKGGTDALAAQVATATAAHQYRTILQRSDDGQKFLAELDYPAEDANTQPSDDAH